MMIKLLNRLDWCLKGGIGLMVRVILGNEK